MIKENNRKRLLVLFLLEFCLLIFFQQTVLAISSEKEKIVTPGNLKEWNDGASVTKATSGKGESYLAEITADTTGLEEDYYSVYIYDNTKRDIRSYDGIRFHYSNQSDNDLKINLTLSINAKTSVTMLEKSFAILEEDIQEATQVVTAEYGTVLIPAQFSGTIYIPFTQLFNEEGENIDLSTIQSFGITTVMEKDQIASYAIGNIAFLSGSVEAMKDSNFLITLSGEEQVTIPSTGAVIEKYTAKVIDLEGNEVNTDVTFYLEDEIEGVSLSKDGTLEIQSNCVANKLNLLAKTSQSINSGTLTLSLERENATQGGVPNPEEVAQISTLVDQRLNDSVLLFRILAVIIALFFVAVFTIWFNQAKANYQTIKRKFNKIFQEQEEEDNL